MSSKLDNNTIINGGPNEDLYLANHKYNVIKTSL